MRGEGSLAVLRPQAKPCGDWPASAPCQRPLGAATISEIYFGICSNIAMGALLAATALWLATL